MTDHESRDVLSTATSGTSPRRLYVKTYGCQMNVYDSDRMREVMAAQGVSDTLDINAADIIVLNTCHIREKAAEKIYSALGQIRELRDERRAQGLSTVVAVAGCVAQAEGAEILRRAPFVDVVVGPQSYHRLPELIDKAAEQGGGIIDVDFTDEDKFQRLEETAKQPGKRHPTAFLTVQEGCDKFCTFCVVPYTRGAEMSRSVEQVLGEARRLVAQGVRELTLLGQNVNAYHGKDQRGRSRSLAGLLEDLSAIEGLERLRYTTSHPRDMGDDLIEAHRDLPKLMPYLHLPFQSGADRVLAAMNRKHTAKDYLVLVERIRDARPDIALSTDIIVGFPGETEAEFEATLGIVRHVGFAQAYSFKYSPRPGTPAASIADQVPESVRTERLARLQALLTSQQVSFNSSCVGKSFPVLLEKPGRQPGQLIGRSPYLQGVHMAAGDRIIGDIVDVEIVAAGPNSLSGVIKASRTLARHASAAV